MHHAARSAALLAALVLIASPAARGQPDAKTRAKSLARYFPAEALVVYGEFDGLDAHDAAWKKTATYKMLTETSTGAMLESLLTQGMERIVAEVPPGQKKPTGKDLMRAFQGLMRSGFALGINRRPNEEKPFSVGLVVRGAAKGSTRALLAPVLDAKRPDEAAKAIDGPGGRRLHLIDGNGQGDSPAWWEEGDDLAFAFLGPKNAEAMIDALEGRKPNAVEETTRAELAKVEGRFEPVGLAFFDMKALPPLPPQFEPFGLDAIKRVDYRWGFEGEALATVLRVKAPAPRRGLLALLEFPSFSPKDLPPIPPEAGSFAAFGLDFLGFYRRATALMTVQDPGAQESLVQAEATFHDQTGKSLRDDVLAPLGPRVATYTIPTRGNLPSNPFVGFAQGMVHVPRTVTLVEVRDADAYAATLQKLTETANRLLARQLGGGPDVAKRCGFLPLKGVERGYIASIPPSILPLPAGMRPTMILGKKWLVIGTTPEVAKAGLALEGKATDLAGGPLAGALEGLPDRVSMLSISDARDSLLPEVVANLPSLVAAFSASQSGSPLQALGVPVPQAVEEGERPAVPIAVDPNLIPEPDDLRKYLFPSVYLLRVDDSGFTIRTREAAPSVNPLAAAPIAAALTLPTVSSARTAARRAQSTNNLKQIGLAIHNYVSANNKLPADLCDKDGKPLLSWRVAILPYLEEQALYNEFHLDEPWDSEHNRPLMERMPNVFKVPGAPEEAGKTFYRGFSGPSALFDPEKKEGLTFADVLDGTSNTLAVVEAKDAVEWSKPGTDLPFDPMGDPKKLREKLGGHFPGGFNALMLDGAVRFLKETIDPDALKAIVTRNAGEVVSPNDL